MKIKICLLSLISIIFIEVAYSQQLGWTFNDIVKFKGHNFERSNVDANNYNISYEKKIMENGKEFIDFIEIYYFHSTTNTVYEYMSAGNKSESEIAEIIEKNNSKFKKVDMGSKQKGFQWIDTENTAEYNLSLFPELNLGEKKYVIYSAEIK